MNFACALKSNGLMRLAGYTGAATNTGAVQTFLQGQNTPGGGTAPSAIALVSGSGSGFVGTTSCPAP